MKLVVPYLGELHPADARLIRLAEFLGIACVPVPAATAEGGGIWAPESKAAGGDACLVMNPRRYLSMFARDGSFARIRFLAEFSVSPNSRPLRAL